MIAKIGESNYRIKHVERKFSVTDSHKLKRVLVWEDAADKTHNEELPPGNPKSADRPDDKSELSNKRRPRRRVNLPLRYRRS